ncbi:hypothetical protein [Undibacterium fentianense]|uniref:MSHA biogenesis protein MshP n=1 Tax=Undibacterium fentianense TaxID=2828728 RepID=A0A941E2J8_9BURK|nr:hypothetical protein [Undibacterium fentianense]MBR7800062.1 hypothetical protein [Undibacterium fentianense]
MNITFTESKRTARQSGFSLVSAIFLLVIFAALGLFMLSIYSSQRSTANQDVRGVLAYQAAKAGLEWGSYQILSLENAQVVNALYANCNPSMGSPSFAGALSNFSVNVSCVQTSTIEDGNTIRVYTLTSTASAGTAPSNDFVERQMKASISTCRLGVAGLPGDQPC